MHEKMKDYAVIRKHEKMKGYVVIRKNGNIEFMNLWQQTNSLKEAFHILYHNNYFFGVGSRESNYCNKTATLELIGKFVLRK